jgi:DNA-binding transcriptional LysR family regulator
VQLHLRTLQIFCAVAHHGSFSKAASALGLTQSAASQAVQTLEEHLGMLLIDRSLRPLGLTRAGRLYRDGVQKLVHDYQSLEDEIRSIGNQLVGRVTVASIYSVGLSYLPEATQAFAVAHPGVEVVVEYTKPSRVVDLVAGGDVDLGLVSYPDEAKLVRSVLWQQEPMRLICAPGHALAVKSEVLLSDLHGIPMIAFESGLAIRRGIDRYLSQRRVKPRVQMEFDNIDSLIRAVQANIGVSIMPEAAVRRETASGVLRILPCVDLNLNRPLGIAWRRGGRLGPAAREFAALLLGRPIEEGREKTLQADGAAKVPEAVP